MYIFLIFLFLFSFPSEGGNIPKNDWPLGLEPDFKVPKNNPLTAEKVRLGQHLFFDKQLSRDESISCATCHDPTQAFSNGARFAQGVAGAIGNRNVPSIVNRLFGQTQFWDGRSETLESQALEPLFNPDEMAMNEKLLLQRLSTDVTYQKLFYDAFGSPEPTIERVSKALACFERTLLTAETAFDRYEWDGIMTALSNSEKRGLSLFRGKARCSICHIGTNFTDEKFHNIGVSEGAGQTDRGRAGVTEKSEDIGKFKTPSLRNIELTAPYMHDGSFARLEDVIAFYDQGGRPNPNLDTEIKPLGLSDAEKADLLAFLKILTGPVFSVKVEELKALEQ
ncbi:MAG: cytochrome-c peroxidase [Candidatus Poribacteria bacterium]|nr:cytochrome-c peroxidase [Candidatus Poribacteria bacterium]